MASARRRSSRTDGNASPGVSATSNDVVNGGETNGESSKVKLADDRCPACTPETIAQLDDEENEEWAMCGACKLWYHWRCAGKGEELGAIDKWFCTSCLEKDTTGKRAITFRAPARKSNRKRTTRDYANLEAGLNLDPKRFLRMMEGKEFKDDKFKRMKGSEVGIEWLENDDSAMQEPIVIEDPEGLGMKMPDDNFTADDVGLLVGEQTPVEVIDVASQSNLPGWTVGKWVEYYQREPHQRDRILNVISLEVSGTLLADRILPPRLVRELDWVENFWPATRKGKGHVYPKVQLYCLMGVEGAWTDWHIDFAGSSVYYHIMHGSKVFYFIKPTPANLAAYERWSGTDIQNHSWLGDMVDEVVKVMLTAGNTMIIPTGWIHAVYTPEDTLVFGGNFLHSYDAATQLKVRDIEIKTHVPKKFRFPMFSRLCWYVGDKYLKDLRSSSASELSPRVVKSICSLANFLLSEVRTLERGSEQAKKEVREQVPHDRVKDAPAMARELRWRIRHAAGYNSEDELDADDVVRNGTNGVSRKRRRARSDSASVDDAPRFKNFRPKVWEHISESWEDEETKTLQSRKPEGETSWAEKWIEWNDEEVVNDEGGVAEVKRRKNLITKIRRTAEGLERERIERVVDKWTWKE